MKLKVLEKAFTVCKVTDYSRVDFSAEFVFVGKTDEECSLVCETERVPTNTTAREDGWRSLRIEGTLDFSLIGILSKISTLLAEAHVGIFAVSTYNTDYVLTKAADFDRALQVLRANDYEIDV